MCDLCIDPKDRLGLLNFIFSPFLLFELTTSDCHVQKPLWLAEWFKTHDIMILSSFQGCLRCLGMLQIMKGSLPPTSSKKVISQKERLIWSGFIFILSVVDWIPENVKEWNKHADKDGKCGWDPTIHFTFYLKLGQIWYQVRWLLVGGRIGKNSARNSNYHVLFLNALICLFGEVVNYSLTKIDSACPDAQPYYEFNPEGQ